MKDEGFSLIELIIVIAIMAVLVAIIAPNLTKYLGNSKIQVDKRNLDEVHHQVMNCLSDCVTRDPIVAVINGEDGVKVAEYELEYNSANQLTSVTPGTNATTGFAVALYDSMKEATTVSRVDGTKRKILVKISGDTNHGYEVSQSFVS